MAFPATELDAVVELAIGADLAADPSTWSWTDVTVREQPKISITRGRRSRVGDIAPTRVQATADNTDGNLCRHNPLGTHYGQLRKNTPMRVRVNNGSGYVTRAAVFVPGFPPSWDPTGADQTVTLTGVGLMDRLGRGRVLRSPLYRSTIGVSPGDFVPAAYWPMEDGSGTTRIAAATPNTAAGVPTGTVTFAAESDLAGSSPLPTFASGGRADFSVPTYVDTGNWAAQIVIKVDAEPAATTRYLEVDSPGGTEAKWIFEIVPGSPAQLRWYGVDNTGASTGTIASIVLVGSLGVPSEAEFFGQWWLITMQSRLEGGEVFANLSIADADGVYSYWTGGSIGSTAHAAASAIRVLGGEGASAGHLALFAASDYDITVDGLYNGQALSGWAGEMAHERAERLCREEGVPFTCAATSSQAMGAQSADARLIELLRECANTDQGLLYEDMSFGLTFVSSTQRRNPATAITLDYDADQVGVPWEPDDDSQDYFNDVTATRPGGSSYRAADEDAIDDVGQYATSVPTNVATDDQLQQIAGFRLAAGLNDELTWPDVRPQVIDGGALLDAWLATDLGEVLAVTNHPSPLAPDAIRQLVEGYTETLGSFSYRVSAILSPASVWDMAVYDTARYDSATTDSIKAITSGATTLDVACGDGIAWTTSGAQYPYDLAIGGERVTATACSNLTLTARTAGTAAHGNNASVTPGLPSGLAEGDVLMVLAAIRNSGTGTVDDEPGYTTLAEFGNVKLQAKYAPSGAAAPQITFTGGVANADTSAQMMAFANCGLQVHNWAAQLNGSAQNIAYPALHVTRDNCLILYIGWKQDDWTSVTGPGTEIGEPDTALGDDQGLVWAYQLQTAATDVAAGSFTVTGGAPAISRGMVIALTTQAQRFTIARAVNGVVKSHAAGTPVRLWNTPRYAL